MEKNILLPQLCDFGCGNPGIFKFTNGKYCCSKWYQSCPISRIKTSENHHRKPKREKPELCEYGCNLPAQYYFKRHDKWCCNEFISKCEGMRKKNSKGLKKYRANNKQEPKLKLVRENPGLCDYGCKSTAIYQLKNGNWCCSKFIVQCSEIKRKNSEKNTGEKNGFYGKHHNEKSLNTISKTSIGRKTSYRRN